MPGKPRAIGILIKKYLAKYPDMPSLTISKLIKAENPGLIQDVEMIRSNVRIYRGTHGKRAVKMLKDKTFFGTGKIAYIPTEESGDYVPLILSENDDNIGVISDLHIPNHRNQPLILALEKLIDLKINTLLINGDLLDNTPFTRFDKAPPSIGDAKRYFDKAEMFLEGLRGQFPKARIIWLEGNHDHWYTKWLMKKAPEVFGDQYFSLTERMHLSDHGIEFLPQERFLMAGKLAVAHGHHIIRGLFAPVNAARGVFLRTKKSCMIGHVHVTSQHMEKDLMGDLIGTWSTGCLCTLTPDYQPMAGKANHGFAHITTSKGGEFHVRNYHIHKGKIL
jgi:predicted phosphodiesterase